mmetsp:Transcript_1694/g.4237  ORF Transcript_1694/g.4237 Transcript_1694/m.4237 type:complete len:85 (-) Transcript_1694:3341-3595(-)
MVMIMRAWMVVVVVVMRVVVVVVSMVVMGVVVVVIVSMVVMGMVVVRSLQRFKCRSPATLQGPPSGTFSGVKEQPKRVQHHQQG